MDVSKLLVCVCHNGQKRWCILYIEAQGGKDRGIYR